MEMNLIMAQPQDAVTTIASLVGTSAVGGQQVLISDETSLFADLLQGAWPRQNDCAKIAEAPTAAGAAALVQNGDPVAMQFTQILTVADKPPQISSPTVLQGDEAETAAARPVPAAGTVERSRENPAVQGLGYPGLPQQQSRLAYTLQEMRKITLDELQPTEPQETLVQEQGLKQASGWQPEAILTSALTTAPTFQPVPHPHPNPPPEEEGILAVSIPFQGGGQEGDGVMSRSSTKQIEIIPAKMPKPDVAPANRKPRNNTAEEQNSDPAAQQLTQLQAVAVQSPVVHSRPENRNEEQKADTLSEEKRNTVQQLNTSAEQSPKPAPAPETGLAFVSAIQSTLTPAADTVTKTETGAAAKSIVEPTLEAVLARPKYLPPKEELKQAADSTMMAEVRQTVDPLLKNTVKQVADQTDPTDIKQATHAAKPKLETAAKPFTSTPSGQNPTQLSGSESLSAKEIPATTAALPSPVRNDLSISEPVEESVLLNHPGLAGRAQKITERSTSSQTVAPIITEAAAPLQRQTGGTNSGEGNGPSISHELFGKITIPGSSRPASDDNEQNKNEPGKDQSAAARSLPLPGATAKAEPVREVFQVKVEEPANPLHKNILDQLKEGIVTHDSKGNGRMSIRLNPADLGELQVNVRMDEHRVKVEIISDNRTVREALMGNLDTLKETLSKQNLSMEGFHVSTSAGEGFSQAFREETGAHKNALRLARNLEQKSPDLPRQSIGDDSGVLENTLVDLRL